MRGNLIMKCRKCGSDDIKITFEPKSDIWYYIGIHHITEQVEMYYICNKCGNKDIYAEVVDTKGTDKEFKKLLEEI